LKYLLLKLASAQRDSIFKKGSVSEFMQRKHGNNHVLSKANFYPIKGKLAHYSSFSIFVDTDAADVRKN